MIVDSSLRGPSCCEHTNKRLGGARRRRRILTCDQPTVDDGDRGLPAPRGRQRELNTGITKDEVGSRKLLQPESRLASRVAEPVVRGDHHYDFHVPLLVIQGSGSNDPCDHIRPDRQAMNNWTIVLPILWYRSSNASVTSQ